jgi:uncharacterized protein involved in exopolysaccharide biosynthesis
VGKDDGREIYSNMNEADLKTDTKDGFDYERALLLIWQSKFLIAKIVGAVTVIAVIVSLILPKYYKSTAVILPETDKSKLASLSQVSALAGLAGLNIGEIPLEQLYPTIVMSEAVLKEVIYAKYQTEEYSQPVDLIEYWGIQGSTPLRSYELALKQLQGSLTADLERPTFVLTVSILTREPKLSADILNNVVHGLDKFLRTKKTNNATERRKWIEQRLDEVKRDLEKSENNLREFRERNRRISESPQLQLELDRLAREVEINSTLYVELKKQYELVKIEEIRNLAIINVMDEARPSGVREKPKRAQIVILWFFLSLVGSIGYVIVVDRYRDTIKELLGFFRLGIGSVKRRKE